MQFRLIQGDCWLYSNSRSTVEGDIVVILLLLLDFYHRLFVSLIILFLCLNFLHNKNTEKQYLVIILSYPAQASEPQADSRDQPILLVRLAYSRKSTGTIVNKFYLVR